MKNWKLNFEIFFFRVYPDLEACQVFLEKKEKEDLWALSDQKVLKESKVIEVSKVLLVP